VQTLLRDADQRAFEHLQRQRADLERLAEALLQREELTRDEIERLLHGESIPTDGQVKPEAQAPVNAEAV
jgi:ATP-dependent Zn protease